MTRADLAAVVLRQVAVDPARCTVRLLAEDTGARPATLGHVVRELVAAGHADARAVPTVRLTPAGYQAALDAGARVCCSGRLLIALAAHPGAGTGRLAALARVRPGMAVQVLHRLALRGVVRCEGSWRPGQHLGRVWWLVTPGMDGAE